MKRMGEQAMATGPTRVENAGTYTQIEEAEVQHTYLVKSKYFFTFGYLSQYYLNVFTAVF